MKAVIVLNGEKLRDYEFNDEDYVIACDRGFEFCVEKGVAPSKIVGDFDSLGYIPDGADVYSVEKDFTDGEIALGEAVKKGFFEVEFICAGGGRDDQFFANAGLMLLAEKSGVKATLVTNYGKIYYATKNAVSNVFTAKKGVTVSVFTFSDCTVKSSKGLKYEYNDTTLYGGSSLGVSNVATADKIELFIEEGECFVFINNVDF